MREVSRRLNLTPVIFSLRCHSRSARSGSIAQGALPSVVGPAPVGEIRNDLGDVNVHAVNPAFPSNRGLVVHQTLSPPPVRGSLTLRRRRVLHPTRNGLNLEIPRRGVQRRRGCRALDRAYQVQRRIEALAVLDCP